MLLDGAGCDFNVVIIFRRVLRNAKRARKSLVVLIAMHLASEQGVGMIGLPLTTLPIRVNRR
jgi:hypothetical protein